MPIRPRKIWSALKPGTRKRKLRYYEREGLTPSQVARRYNAGTLGPQKAVRGHKETPEHGLGQALDKPEKYRKYIARKSSPAPGLTPEEEARERNDILDEAYASMRRLREYVYYNDATVRANVYGGTSPGSGIVPGMSQAEAIWTAQADVEEIRSRASEQYRANPWWYH